MAEKDNKIGAVMVLGGGIGGMQAAIDLADSGFKVYLVEKSPFIGGRMAQLDKTFPTNDCAMCTISPRLVGAGRHLNIEILPSSDIVRVDGEAGNFKITLRQRQSFVDLCRAGGNCCSRGLYSGANENLRTKKRLEKTKKFIRPRFNQRRGNRLGGGWFGFACRFGSTAAAHRAQHGSLRG